MIQIYHNPRCGKSRECVAMLEQTGKKFETVLYLNDPPKAPTLKALVKLLKIKPIGLIRQKEAIWIALYKDRKLTDNQIISAMVAHPILIERPIVINGEMATIARPTENIFNVI